MFHVFFGIEEGTGKYLYCDINNDDIPCRIVSILLANQVIISLIVKDLQTKQEGSPNAPSFRFVPQMQSTALQDHMLKC